MPDSYFRASEVPEIVGISNLSGPSSRTYRVGGAATGPAVKWEAFPGQGHSIVSFCTWDREQLLAKIAGSFSVVPINILSADIFSRGDNVVLDIFRVCDTKDRAVTDKRDFELVEELCGAHWKTRTSTLRR